MARTAGDPRSIGGSGGPPFALGHLGEARDAFLYLGNIDEEPDHEIFAYHGLIETELRRERWRAALDLAVDATRVDRYGRTTDVLAFAVAQVFGATNRAIVA